MIKDIVLSKDVEDSFAAMAKEKRLAESKILNAQAEVESAKLMRQTADILSGKAAMQIRYLEALKGIASNNGVKVVFLAEDDWYNNPIIQAFHSREYQSDLKTTFLYFLYIFSM